MEKLLRDALMYDFYGNLLTGRQRLVYGMYHADNLTLQEIADELDITRQGVRDLLKRAEAAMQVFDKELALVDKHMAYIKGLKEISDKLGALISRYPADRKLCAALGEIKALSDKLSEV